MEVKNPWILATKRNVIKMPGSLRPTSTQCWTGGLESRRRRRFQCWTSAQGTSGAPAAATPPTWTCSARTTPPPLTCSAWRTRTDSSCLGLDRRDGFHCREMGWGGQVKIFIAPEEWWNISCRQSFLCEWARQLFNPWRFRWGEIYKMKTVLQIFFILNFRTCYNPDLLNSRPDT